KLLLFGLGSWATSIGILFKNKSLVNAIRENKSRDKILITNPVKDDETIGMSWWESTEIFLKKIMGYSIHRVFKKILANNNSNLDRYNLPARPNLVTVQQVYDGYLGGYFGENSPRPEDIKNLETKGVKSHADLNMAVIKLTPQRMNPDLYNANIAYVPELFAEGLWELMDESTKSVLSTRDEVEVIKKHSRVEELLRERGLSLLSLGVQDIHDVVFYPQLVRELKAWLDEDRVPTWIADKRNKETMFQFVIRKAMEQAGADARIDPEMITLGNEIMFGKVGRFEIKIKFLGIEETDCTFTAERALLADKITALMQEELHRLGIIRPLSGQNHALTIKFPYEILELGITPQEKIERLSFALSFQIEKARRLIEIDFRNEQTAHQEAIAAFIAEGKEEMLNELSVAVPFLRFLRFAIAKGLVPNVMFDMDGNFTAAGTALTAKMAFYAWKFFKNKGTLKTPITGQQFEATHKQIFEEVQQIRRIRRWTAVRTGIGLSDTETDADVWGKVILGVSSGGAIFTWDDNHQGYVKVRQESMDALTINFIELAARMVMPDVGYPVEGHQVEPREPHPQEDGSILFAAYAVIPSGRYDTKRNWDLPPKATQRRLLANRMTKLLENPRGMLEQVAVFLEQGLEAEWIVIIGEANSAEKLKVLPEQRAEITNVYRNIIRLLEWDKSLSKRLDQPINISCQPGGATTLDISPVGKGKRIPVIVAVTDKFNTINQTEFVRTIDNALPDSKGHRIPG
ncbi:MAG: hypothetical protein KKE91_01500, partial [Candidatus Omnitrophica bacterium]|nr:hypothetical protein [Candidatus Omnitrophota bacterium]